MGETGDARSIPCPAVATDDTAGLLSGRYRLLEEAGHGGVASVYRAQDGVTGKTLALKRLKASDNPERAAAALALFEREFQTLSQLAHPHIVTVHAYHVDDTGAFYTMEMLDGGDLRSRLPLDPTHACVLMRDVCSALCLIHSRRLVHRDISPRNLRCTDDGRVKLIDFGALVPMDNSAPPVGTPTFCAPEIVAMEPLDGRADLYALGTTLYFALTGRAAYSARSFRELREAWRVAPPPPSQLRADIPPALDHLVMELIQLDRRARPVHAAEVMERLSAIAGVVVEEQLLVSQAYLNTPILVGRDRKLARMREHFRRVKHGERACVLIEAATGVGRTRYINTCGLEAQLLGLTVVSASGDGAGAPYAAARALARQLCDAHPTRARGLLVPHAGVLRGLLPELLEPGPGPCAAEEGAELEHAAIQSALMTWLLELSTHHPLALLIDDFDQLDEPSARLLAVLAHESENHAVALIATAHPRARSCSNPCRCWPS